MSSSHAVTVNLYENVVWFRFNNILLVDSVMNEELSHGFVKYTIKPLSTCVIGDQIDNTAYIYFDYNLPVVTNTTTTNITNYVGNEASKIADLVSIYPNPCGNDPIQINSANPINSITIQNIAGQNLSSMQTNGKYQVEINLSNLAKGIYLIKVSTDNGFNVIKIVKSE